MQIRYANSLHGINTGQLNGFFIGWPKPLDGVQLMKVLAGSHQVVLAIDEESNKVVGFANAISDGILMAFIPLLEVKPEYQRHGIGRELLRRMLERLRGFYGVDLICDPEKKEFYESFGMQALTGMVLRRREKL